MKGHLYLEDIIGFRKGFWKVTKNLGFHLVLKSLDSQDIRCTPMTDHINVTITNPYLFIRNLILSVETQIMFKEATQNNNKILYEEYFTERRVITDFLFQHLIGSAQQVNSPKYLISAHQTKDRILTSKKIITWQYLLI